MVLTLDEDVVAEVTGFGYRGLFASFRLPEVLGTYRAS
jgi:hypothetical protein